MAQTSGSLTTTGSVTLAGGPGGKQLGDTLTQVQISGTYGTVTFVIEGTLDGTNWDGLTAIKADTRAFVAGTISPTDNATDVYEVASAGYASIRARATAVGSGTVNFFLSSGAYVGLPAPVLPNSTPSSLGSAGSDLTILGGLAFGSVTNGITAFSGGGQGSAVALTSTVNRITTVAAGNDSVKMPAATAGKTVIVMNAAASNSANVFPQSGEAINALSANAAFALAANKCAIFVCAVAGTWTSVLTA